jgi:MGT family glycosyltransferase
MSARVLFACWPFEGHVFPQLGIAHALRDRGNDVAFYTAEMARPTVEREEFTFFPFRHVDEVWRPVHALEARTGGRHQSPRVQRAALRCAVDTIPDQVADLEPILESWQPDVLVTDLSMWAPTVILWEAAPIPVAMSAFMGALVPGPDAPPMGLGLAPPRTRRQRALAWALMRATDVLATPLRRGVDRQRARYGLAPMGCSVTELTGRLPLYLVGGIRELDYNRRDLPTSVHYVGSCTAHPPQDPATAAWLEHLPERRPWVHVTEGTTHYKDPFLLKAATQGLANGPWEAILTTGRQRDPSHLGLVSAPNVHATRWLSHSELLPRCDVMVTTGGAGAVMAALKAGVPLVVVPTTWDKPDNARRVVEAGVGVRLPPRRCTPDRLRAAVAEVLFETRYVAMAQHMSTLLANAPGPAGAAELLEALAPKLPPVCPRAARVSGSGKDPF